MPPDAINVNEEKFREYIACWAMMPSEKSLFEVQIKISLWFQELSFLNAFLKSHVLESLTGGWIHMKYTPVAHLSKCLSSEVQVPFTHVRINLHDHCIGSPIPVGILLRLKKVSATTR